MCRRVKVKISVAQRWSRCHSTNKQFKYDPVTYQHFYRVTINLRYTDIWENSAIYLLPTRKRSISPIQKRVKSTAVFLDWSNPDELRTLIWKLAILKNHWRDKLLSCYYGYTKKPSWRTYANIRIFFSKSLQHKTIDTKVYNRITS